MKIALVTPYLSRLGGGIPQVVWELAQEFEQRQHSCVVAGLDDVHVAEDCAGRRVRRLTGRIKGLPAFGFSAQLRDAMLAEAPSFKIVHAHGLWMYPGWLARRCAKRARAPLVISPHGMLDRWALRRSAWKKKLAAWVFENANLRRAACLHALCSAEADDCRRYGLRNPIAVIPNGVHPRELEPLPPREAATALWPALTGCRCVLFLSRIHPKKGLINLLSTWRKMQVATAATLGAPGWRLVIAGMDQEDHEAELKRMARASGMESSVFFAGPVQGEAKRDLLAAADVFVLPSLSEGFSMAILEAAAAGLPVLLTPHCNFPELVRAGGALEVTPDAQACEAGLRQLLAMSDAERRAMGRRGHDLVARNYTWSRVAEQMLGVYNWLLGKSLKPAYVTL